MISDLILLAFMVGLITYWVFRISKYDWSKWEQDQEQAKKDLF